MECILDSHAWIEYFNGSKKGEIVRRLFSNENDFITIECCLAEIKGWALKNNKNFDELYRLIISNSEILEIEENDWIKAAEERFEQRKTQKDFGLIDAMILVKQKELNCKIISGDSHFEKIKNVIFLRG